MLVIGDKSNVFFFWAKEKAKKCLPLQVKCYAFNEVKNTSTTRLPMRLYKSSIAFSEETKMDGRERVCFQITVVHKTKAVRNS